MTDVERAASLGLESLTDFLTVTGANAAHALHEHRAVVERGSAGLRCSDTTARQAGAPPALRPAFWRGL
ncbi:MAG: hypothetical protein ACYCT1_08760 [Steroidobacteraceae bacterium]